MKPQAWKLLSRRELDAIAASLLPRAQAWGKAWLPACAIGLEVVDAAANAPGAAPLLALQEAKALHPGAVLHAQTMPHALLQAAGRACGQASISPGLRERMAAHALRDLLARLAGLPAGTERKLQLFPERPTLAPPRRGSGEVVALLRLDAEELPIRLMQAAPRGGARGVAPRGALSARLDALGSQQLRLRTVAGEASLPLSDFLALAPGDVVLLGHGPEAPMCLESAAGQRVAGGYLGLRGARPVLQIATDS
jgi:hypothetical protein